MHELSVLAAAVDLPEETARANDIDKLAWITLEVGQASGYLPVFFEKYWPIVVEGKPLFDGCELRMVEKRGEALCLECGAMFDVMACEGVCPACGSRVKKMLGGTELVLKEVGAAES